MAKTPETILVVDDDHLNRELLWTRLRDAGYTVLKLTCGTDALDFLQAHKPALILLDIEMPDMDGLQVLSSVREQYSSLELPVIMVTARDESEVIIQALRQGANDYVNKPLDLPVVLARVETQLRLQRMNSTVTENEERFRRLAENAADLIYRLRLGAEPVFEYVSPAAQEMTGFTPDEFYAFPEILEWLVHPRDKDLFEAFLADPTSTESPVAMRWLQKSGNLIWVENRWTPIPNDKGEIIALEGIIRDITKSKFYDTLTGLPNASLFRERLEHILSLLDQDAERNFSVMHLNLDRFKLINESLGHTAGDQLLKQAADRILKHIRPGDTLARLGGDEFALLLENIKGITDASNVAVNIQREFGDSFPLNGQDAFLNLSIGITFGGVSSPEIMRAADTAMHRAKAQGSGRYEIFDPEMHRQSLHLLQMDTELRRAQERGEFELHFQPIVAAAPGTTSKLECLIRWRHPERGMVPPGEFIGHLEDTELIIPVGEWILDTACRLLKKWHLAGFDHLSMAINFSTIQFRKPNIVQFVSDTIARHGLPPRHIELELTESLLMGHEEETIKVLHELKEVGVQLSIDDFGTGYSSLAYLKRFPLDTLKIDRGFVLDMEHNKDNQSIVSAIVALAHIMNLKVVAEGVETAEQVEILRELQCDYLQGYFFSRPQPESGVDAVAGHDFYSGPLSA